MQNPTHLKEERREGSITTIHDTKYLKFLFLCCGEWGSSSSVATGVRGRRGGDRRRRGGLALVALGEKPKSVNLPDKVGDAGPSSKPKPNHKDPYHNEGIEDIHCRPAWHEERRLLCSILRNKSNTLNFMTGFHNFERGIAEDWKANYWEGDESKSDS